jgi:hypothetical protein
VALNGPDVSSSNKSNNLTEAKTLTDDTMQDYFVGAAAHIINLFFKLYISAETNSVTFRLDLHTHDGKQRNRRQVSGESSARSIVQILI